MNHRHWFLFHLAVCVPFVLGGTTAAQLPPTLPRFTAPSSYRGAAPGSFVPPPMAPAPYSSPSHRVLPETLLDRAEAEKRLSARLGHAQDLSKFDSVLDKLLKDFDPKDLTEEEKTKLLQIAAKRQEGKRLDFSDPQVQRVMEKMHGLKKGDLGPDDVKALEKIGQEHQDGNPIDLNDPQVAKVVQKLFDRNKTDIAKTEELALDDKQLEDLWQRFGPKLDSSGKPIKSPVGGSTGSPDGATTDTKKPDTANPAGEPPFFSGSTPPNVSPPVPSTPGPPSWLSQQLLKFAENIDLDDSDKDSLAKLLKDVAKSGGNAPKTPDLGNLPNVGEYVPSDKINSAGGFFGKMKMPSLPSIGSINPPRPNVSSGGGGVGGGVDGLFQVLIGALALLLVGLVVWKLASVYKATLEAKGNDSWKLGGWPVHPAAVRTRADLVRAFEYLAVLCLGADARTRNHLELGDELGRQSPTLDARRTEAARTLAHLYEIARYTPDEETLPPDEMATARRELSFLAGTASA